MKKTIWISEKINFQFMLAGAVSKLNKTAETFLKKNSIKYEIEDHYITIYDVYVTQCQFYIDLVNFNKEL